MKKHFCAEIGEDVYLVSEVGEQIATLKDDLKTVTVALGQAGDRNNALTTENKRLREMMSIMPESFWDAQAAIGKEEGK